MVSLKLTLKVTYKLCESYLRVTYHGHMGVSMRVHVGTSMCACMRVRVQATYASVPTFVGVYIHNHIASTMTMQCIVHCTLLRCCNFTKISLTVNHT